ncbi:hypothetical protein [Oceaniradius stylonematis]|uniref:hypothetical protein n=1 Tax=Oceaniradius stylonematis TaxID=2184161 RepID=UPI00273D406A|nr:hypothetical protein [Oceaniradius stylonematis]
MLFRLTGDERVTERCATDGCGQQPMYRFESGDVGSYYCGACADIMREMAEEERHQEEMRELERQAMEEHFAKHPHG